jgi:PTH1 family peptidyl-tRNA hydrolase
VGFGTVDLVADRHGGEWREVGFWNCLRSRCRIRDEEVTLVKPLSYVNLSGPVVRKVSADLEVGRPDLLVVLDDFWLPLGRLRLRTRGGGGGHRGMESIIRAMGDAVPRLRIGIGSPESGEAVDHVLSRFRPEEREKMSAVLERAADALEIWASEGAEAAMNAYNPEE